MSILIKSMKMPKGRPVCIVIDAAGQARHYDLNNDRYTDDKLFEVVSVPPHGRLIDADALDNTLGIEDRDIYVHWTLESSPTIIPAEEGEEEA